MTPERIAELRAFAEGSEDAASEGIPVSLHAELTEALDALESDREQWRITARERDAEANENRRLQELLEAVLEEAAQYRYALVNKTEPDTLFAMMPRVRAIAEELGAERARSARLRGALVLAAAPLEVLNADDSPWIGRELRAGIHAGCMAVRAALCEETER